MRYPPGYYEQQYNFDFFNYAGIHRPVVLYAYPRTFIEDINVTTSSIDYTTNNAILDYSINVEGLKDSSETVQDSFTNWKKTLDVLMNGILNGIL